MHTAQTKFVMRMKSLFSSYFKGRQVIEIGSADINGSVRWLFSGCFYMGVDICPGPGVDILWTCGFPFSVPAEVYVSCECLEHDAEWSETVKAMVKGTKEMLLITCATTGRPEHGTRRTSLEDSPCTGDYYMNITQDHLEPLIRGKFYWYKFWIEGTDLYFIGFKNVPQINSSLIHYVWLEIKLFVKMRWKDNLNGMAKLLNGRSPFRG